MTSRLIKLFVSALAIAVLATPAAGQPLPRAADGKPDFSGIWQALTTANWNILAHAADRTIGTISGLVNRSPLMRLSDQRLSDQRLRCPRFACESRAARIRDGTRPAPTQRWRV